MANNNNNSFNFSTTSHHRVTMNHPNQTIHLDRNALGQWEGSNGHVYPPHGGILQHALNTGTKWWVSIPL